MAHGTRAGATTGGVPQQPSRRPPQQRPSQTRPWPPPRLLLHLPLLPVGLEVAVVLPVAAVQGAVGDAQQLGAVLHLDRLVADRLHDGLGGLELPEGGPRSATVDVVVHLHHGPELGRLQNTDTGRIVDSQSAVIGAPVRTGSSGRHSGHSGLQHKHQDWSDANTGQISNLDPGETSSNNPLAVPVVLATWYKSHS